MKKLKPLKNLIVVFLLFLCQLGYAHGPIHESIKRVTGAIEKSPANAMLYLERGKYYQIDMDFDNAFADFTKARSLDNELSEVNFYCAKLFSEHAYPVSALNYVQVFLKEQPSHINGLILRASIYTQLKKDSLAILDFEQAIKNSREPKPEYFIEISKAVLLADSTNFQESISWLERGEEALGFNIVLKSYALDIAKKQKNYEKALSIIDNVLLKLNRKETWLFAKAEVEELANRPTVAKSTYNEALIAIQQLPVRIQRTRMVMELEAKISMALLKLDE